MYVGIGTWCVHRDVLSEGDDGCRVSAEAW
jgi:hypothetical protein